MLNYGASVILIVKNGSMMTFLFDVTRRLYLLRRLISDPFVRFVKRCSAKKNNTIPSHKTLEVLHRLQIIAPDN